MDFTKEISTDWAFDRYEAIRPRLPVATFPKTSRHADNLADLAEHFDAFVLDAFGVLNRGEEPVPGAPSRIAELRKMGKKLIVLTNAASYTRDQLLEKYHRLGFDFTAAEVVSSRDVALATLPLLPGDRPWAAASLAHDSYSDSTVSLQSLHDTPDLYERAGGFILLSSGRWVDADTNRLIDALRREPRPLIVANPDLVAPRDTGLSIEPGTIAHDIADATGIQPSFFGKPFGNAFHVASSRLQGVPSRRIAMVGDTLHTDILGGAAAGFGTVLITDHGLFQGRDTAPFITLSGLCPDWIVPTT
ncbi:HAD-IIA family hydrolase [uncultured Pelagimonas sp.]|uniref:HAD-IIA family hydrolase n=1 Tax=uncultured Pelagimonas sp. TaxID=1618102 RepID=UPI0026362461|nr:HAD-IIA family hydrolase [uncultured Pelagimonas sp.]